ncbi:MAG: hypothetical protein ACTSQI_08985 [Candidatus Helarchaeota archaeon]
MIKIPQSSTKKNLDQENENSEDQEIKESADVVDPLQKELLEELRHLRSRAGIRMSVVIGYDGTILGIHEDAAYVPKRLRKGENHARSSKIDRLYITKWSTSIHRTIEFVSEKLFESGVNIILLEGNDQSKAIIVNMKADNNLKGGKPFLLVGILPIKGTIGLAYQEMKESADRIAKILLEYNFTQKN